MRKIYLLILLLSFALTGCAAYGQNQTLLLEGESMEIFDQQSEAEESSDLLGQTWQDAYADMLRKSLGNLFYLCDIDSDGISELLLGGPSSDTDKMAEFEVYGYKSNLVESLGTVATLRWSSLWLDDHGGILGYAYGAGGGGTYRYYINNDILCYDDEVEGYSYDLEGNEIRWFRGLDGSRIVVTKENESEYDTIWKRWVTLERYIASEDTISTVIYGGA